jgi:hypothetical protein
VLPPVLRLPELVLPVLDGRVPPVLARGCAIAIVRRTSFLSGALLTCGLFCTGVKIPFPNFASTSALANKALAPPEISRLTTLAPPAMSWAMAPAVMLKINVAAANSDHFEGLLMFLLRPLAAFDGTDWSAGVLACFLTGNREGCAPVDLHLRAGTSPAPPFIVSEFNDPRP